VFRACGDLVLNKGTFVACRQNIDAWDVHNHGLPRVFRRGLTPELTGAGGPIGPQGTNIGHQNREAMANVGVRVERFVRLGSVGTVWQVDFPRVGCDFLKESS
jgi:hypothetical protein